MLRRTAVLHGSASIVHLGCDMDRSIALQLTAAVWLVNIGVTALAIHGLEHPKPYVAAADVWQPSEPRFKLVEDTKAEVEPQPGDESVAIYMPMATIAADRRGNAELQAAPDVVIGPGIVTHPSAIPPRPAR